MKWGKGGKQHCEFGDIDKTPSVEGYGWWDGYVPGAIADLILKLRLTHDGYWFGKYRRTSI